MQCLQQVPLCVQSNIQKCPVSMHTSAGAHLPLWSPGLLSTHNGPPFASDELTEFHKHHHIEHHTSSPHFPRSNGFIERQVRTTKTALNTTFPAKKSLEAVLMYLRSTPIRPKMPALHEILHNRTIQQSGKPYQPIDLEKVRSFLISRRQAQCDQFNKAHKAQALSEFPQAKKSCLDHQQMMSTSLGPFSRRLLCCEVTSLRPKAKGITEQGNMYSQST